MFIRRAEAGLHTAEANTGLNSINSISERFVTVEKRFDWKIPEFSSKLEKKIGYVEIKDERLMDISNREWH